MAEPDREPVPAPEPLKLEKIPQEGDEREPEPKPATEDLEPVDYLIVGGGAMGIAFLDSLLTEKPEATAIIVDNRAKPGGHWVDSYAFVRLHQPAAFYGVESEKLEHDGNPAELTPGPEVQQYFERVLTRLVDGGRVRYFPACRYDRAAAVPAGQPHRFESVDRSASYRVRVDCKLVDAAYLTAVTSSTRPPPFDFDSSAPVVGVAEILELEKLQPSPQKFVVVGAGKTGVDAVLHLLANGVDHASIKWIAPNDAVMFDRGAIFFDAEPDMTGIPGIPGPFCVLDECVQPQNVRCATVSRDELEQLRTVKDVVRLGRVVRVSEGTLHLERGTVALDAVCLLVDCTGDGLRHQVATPVFCDNKITLQSVITCQQVFSAALIAHVECMGQHSEAKKNEMCTPVPHPLKLADMGTTRAITERNKAQFNAEFGEWMSRSRLNMDNYMEKLRHRRPS